MNRRIAVIILFSLLCIVVYSQETVRKSDEIKKLWIKIDDAKKNNLVQSTLDYARKIYTVAQSYNNYQDMILSTEVIIDYTFSKDWKKGESVIKEFAGKFADYNDTVARAVFKCSLLKHLHYSQYNYEDISLLKNSWIKEVLSNKEKLKRAPKTGYEEILLKDENNSNYSGTSIYEYVLLNIIKNTYPRANNETTLKKYYNELMMSEWDNINNFLASKVSYIQLYEDGDKIEKLSLYEKLIKDYGQYPNVILAVIQKIRILENDKEKYREIVDYGNFWINKYPNHREIGAIHQSMNNITRKDIRVFYPLQIYPGKNREIPVAIKNISSLELMLYKIDNPESIVIKRNDFWNITINDSILKSDATLVRTKNLGRQKHKLGITDTCRFNLNIDQEGVYVVRLVSEKNEIVNDARVYVGKTAGISRVLKKNKYQFYAADFYSGEPCIKDTLNFFATVQKSPHATYYKRIGKKNVEYCGFTSVEIPDVNNIKTEGCFRTGEFGPIGTFGHFWNNNGNSSASQKMPARRIITEIFTDRVLYRSSDTIFYKAISAFYENKEFSMNSGAQIEVFLRQRYGEKIASQKLETNDFGSVAGFFVLPAGSSKGEYTIYTNDNNYAASVRIEEYKRPGFLINIQPIAGEYKIGDSINVKGSIISYSGFPLKGAKVNYIVAGTDAEIVTDSEGNFSIPVHLKLDNKLGKRAALNNRILLNISVTDNNGETHSLLKTIFFGDATIQSYNTVPALICKEAVPKFHIRAMNFDWEKVNLKGRFEIIKDTVIATGQFTTWEDLLFDWTKLESGKYKFKYFIYGKNEIQKVDSSNLVLFSKRDKVVPDNNDFFYYALNNQDVQSVNGKIEFLMGTVAERLFAEVEIIDGDSVLWRKPLIVDKGMKIYSFDYPVNSSNDVTLSITSILKGKLYSRTEQYKWNPNSETGINIDFKSIREKYNPGKKESVIITIKDNSGNPIKESELMLSIYDKTTDRFRANSFFVRNNLYAVARSGLYSNSTCFNTTYGVSHTLKTPTSLHLGSEEEIPFAIRDYEDVTYGTSIRGSGDLQNRLPEDEILIRKKFSEKLLFLPQLRPDANGEIKVDFNTSHLLSTFRVMAQAYTKEFKFANAEKEFVINKEVMLMSNIPTFFRAGDSIAIQTTVINLTNEQLSGIVSLNIFDPHGKDEITNTDIKDIKINLLQSAQKNVKWKIGVPSAMDSIGIRITLSTQKYTDAEEYILPILPRTIEICKSKAFVLEKPGTRKFNVSDIIDIKSNPNHELKVEISSPMDMVFESLKKIAVASSPNLFDYLSTYFAKAYLNDKDLNAFREKAVDVFLALQKGNGFFSWYANMEGNDYLSYLFLEKMKQINNVCRLSPNEKEQKIIKAAINNIDEHFVSQHALELERRKESGFGYIPAYKGIYLHVRSMYPEYPLDEKTRGVVDYYLKALDTLQVRPTVLENVIFANALISNGKRKEAERFVQSIREYAVKNETAGYYFPNAVLPYRGFVNNELSAHASILNLFTEIGDKEMIHEIKKWILLQKGNQIWTNNLIITDVVYALIKADGGLKNITHKKKPTDYRIDENTGELKIHKQSNSLEFMYIYNFFKQEVSQIKSFGNGLDIEHKYFKVYFQDDREKLIEINPSTVIVPGDIIQVVYNFYSNENRSYVRIIGNNASCLSPCDEKSGYNGIHYREVRSSSIVYYYNMLPEGNHKITERFFVTQEGIFSTSISTIESLFIPVQRGNTHSLEIKTTTF